MEIFKTTNYQVFKKLAGNRKIDKLNLQRLVNSMNENYLISPIDVNEYFEVIDGQHRLEACRITGNPVYYIVHENWGLKEAHRLNANQRNWTTEQYLQGYCDMKNEDYLKFQTLWNEYSEFPFFVMLSICSGISTRPDGEAISKFKNGQFVFVEKTPLNKLIKLRKLKEFHNRYNMGAFACAVLTALKNPEFDFDEFCLKLSYQTTKLVSCLTTKHYLLLIEEVYNYKRRGNKIRFN